MEICISLRSNAGLSRYVVRIDIEYFTGRETLNIRAGRFISARFLFFIRQRFLSLIQFRVLWPTSDSFRLISPLVEPTSACSLSSSVRKVNRANQIDSLTRRDDPQLIRYNRSRPRAELGNYSRAWKFPRCLFSFFLSSL